jgi:hypothetical protein
MRCQNRHITLTLNASTCRGVRGLISKHLLPIDDCDAKLDRSEFAMIIISIMPEYGPFRLEDCQSFVGGTSRESYFFHTPHRHPV